MMTDGRRPSSIFLFPSYVKFKAHQFLVLSVTENQWDKRHYQFTLFAVDGCHLPYRWHRRQRFSTDALIAGDVLFAHGNEFGILYRHLIGGVGIVRTQRLLVDEHWQQRVDLDLVGSQIEKPLRHCLAHE